MEAHGWRDTWLLLLLLTLWLLCAPLLAGPPLPPPEVQQLLFGSDEKCFTRMTPVVLLLAKSQHEEDVLHPSRFLSVAGVVETVPYPQPRCVAFRHYRGN